VELLAIAICSCSEIKGIKIDSKEFQMVQYADDLTTFVSDIRSAQYLFKLLDQFEKCSGLKVNYTKTEAMWIGSSRNNTETPLALKWCKTVKALGVHLRDWSLFSGGKWPLYLRGGSLFFELHFGEGHYKKMP